MHAICRFWRRGDAVVDIRRTRHAALVPVQPGGAAVADDARDDGLRLQHGPGAGVRPRGVPHRHLPRRDRHHRCGTAPRAVWCPLTLSRPQRLPPPELHQRQHGGFFDCRCACCCLHRFLGAYDLQLASLVYSVPPALRHPRLVCMCTGIFLFGPILHAYAMRACDWWSVTSESAADSPRLHFRAGVTQRATRSGIAAAGRGGGQGGPAHGAYPCFHAVPESQPVLPCLLRRLLQKNKTEVSASAVDSRR